GNQQAVGIAETYRPFEYTETPDCILILGRDGAMLSAIRQHWRRRVPFLGIHQGHLGFLLNEPEALLGEHLSEADLIVRQMPMLLTEIETTDGNRHTELAFNDA